MNSKKKTALFKKQEKINFINITQKKKSKVIQKSFTFIKQNILHSY